MTGGTAGRMARPTDLAQVDWTGGRSYHPSPPRGSSRWFDFATKQAAVFGVAFARCHAYGRTDQADDLSGVPWVRLDARVPVVVVILPETALATADAGEAGDRLDPHDEFGVLV